MVLSFRSGGESHGPGCLAVLEGLPKGLPVDLEEVDRQLGRRQSGYGRSSRQKIERDRVEVLGGLYRGNTIDAPLCLWVPNRVHNLEKLPQLSRPRPGHADLSGCLRHGDRDIRANLERASARETAARVAAGAVAAQLLRHIGLEVLGHVIGIGDVEITGEAGSGLRTAEALRAARERVAASDLAVLVADVEKPMRDQIDARAKEGDSLGGLIEIVAADVPPGLGSFSQWDRRLDGRLARALMSIQAIKAVGIGLGSEVAKLPGSRVHDHILPAEGGGIRRGSNHAGGLEGGVTNGEPLVARIAKKPISTLRRSLPSVDLETGEATEAAFERSDVCAVPAASVVAEAMVALVLADACLELFGGASLEAFCAGHSQHRARIQRVVPPSAEASHEQSGGS